MISDIILPIIILIIVSHGIYKRVDIFDIFCKGVKEGITTTLKIYPTILAMLIAINIFLKSNIIKSLTNILKPLFLLIKMPIEILPLVILKPISGSSSLIVMNELLKTYGPDSYIGKISSVIQGSTDTTIYILSLYFASVGIRKTKYALKVGLIADLLTIIIAIITVNLLFYN